MACLDPSEDPEALIVSSGHVYSHVSVQQVVITVLPGLLLSNIVTSPLITSKHEIVVQCICQQKLHSHRPACRINSHVRLDLVSPIDRMQVWTVCLR